MFEIGPKHPLTYRQEIVLPFFNRVRSAEILRHSWLCQHGKNALARFPDRAQMFRLIFWVNRLTKPCYCAWIATAWPRSLSGVCMS